MEKKLLVPSCYVLWIIVISLFYIPTAEGGGKAEFKLEGMDHAIFLPVIINDLPYELLFDTGATFTVLDSSFKPLLGKPIDKSVVETTVGKTDIDMYKPVGISAGSLDLSNKHAFLLTNFDFLAKIAGRKFHGVIGMASLYQHVWEINFDDKLIIANPDPTEVNIPEGFEELPMLPTAQGVPTVRVNIAGVNKQFILDTGDEGTGRLTPDTIDMLLEKNLIATIAYDTTISLSGITRIRRVRVREMKVGDNVYKNVIMIESLQNALGLGFLNRHNVILNFPDKQLYVKKGLGSFRQDREDKSGIKLLSHQEHIVVAQVDDKGPASFMGIVKGDVIKAINGIPVTGADLQKVRSLLKGMDEERIALSIKRDGGEKKIIFNLKEAFDHIQF